MRRAAIGYLRAGDAVSAEVALLRVLELTEKLRLPHQGYATRELLFGSCIAQGAHTRAEAHLDAMIAANLGTTAGYLQLMRLSAETRLAWSLKNAEMVAHIESGAFSQTPHTIPYLSHNMLTNELALSLLRDQRESARQYLSPLIDLHLKSRSMGRQDYCAEVLFAALRLLGRHRIAGRLAGEYYTIHRREVRSTLWNTSGVEF